MKKLINADRPFPPGRPAPALTDVNFNHLFYFYTFAREGSLRRACEKLYIAQPTLSAQLRKLERTIGRPLLLRKGRYLQLNEDGRKVFGYLEELFGVGRTMLEDLHEQRARAGLRLEVGVADVLPKLVTYQLLEPALLLPEPVHLVCHERGIDQLLARLATHELDLVLSDAPADEQIRVKAHNHFLGECGVSVFGAPEPARRLRRGFPKSIREATWLLPMTNTSLRRELDRWFERADLRPSVRGEFDDSALTKVFAGAGAGLIAAPSVLAPSLRRQFGLVEVGTIPGVREQFYVISVDPKLRNPAARAIVEAARRNLFA